MEALVTGITPLLLSIAICIASFLIAFLIEAILIPSVIHISWAKQLYDMPDARKSHTTPTSRLGGITFFPVLCLTFLSMMGAEAIVLSDASITYNASYIIRITFSLCGAILLVLIGVKDDLVSVRYSYKFILQTIAALSLIASGTYINNLYGLFGIHELPPYISFPISLILIVYIINSINLIDGVNGLAASLSCISAFALGCFLVIDGNYHYAPLAFAVVGMLIPYYYYNTTSGSKIFMGDTGSLTLGYMLALLTIHYSMQDNSSNIIPQSSPLIIAWSTLFIPMFDTARVICIRAWQGKNIFSPDRNHIHHKLIDLGYSHKKTTYILAACSISIIAINLLLKAYIDINLIFIINIAMGIIFNRYFNWKKKTKEKSIFIYKGASEHSSN